MADVGEQYVAMYCISQSDIYSRSSIGANTTHCLCWVFVGIYGFALDVSIIQGCCDA